jgi:hypothetical protein
MAEKTTVSGSVSVQTDSKARVAFDLMQHIRGYEEMDKAAPRQYWLELFRDCMHVASGGDPGKVQERPRTKK